MKGHTGEQGMAEAMAEAKALARTAHHQVVGCPKLRTRSCQPRVGQCRPPFTVSVDTGLAHQVGNDSVCPRLHRHNLLGGGC